MTTTILSNNGRAVGGGRVQLQHNPTAADGSNSGSADPLGLTTIRATNSAAPSAYRLGPQNLPGDLQS